jgi:H+-transporting ATPase
VLDDIFKLLQCDDKGLDADEAGRRLERFGANKLESEEQRASLQVRRTTLPQRIRAKCSSIV